MATRRLLDELSQPTADDLRIDRPPLFHSENQDFKQGAGDATHHEVEVGIGNSAGEIAFDQIAQHVAEARLNEVAASPPDDRQEHTTLVVDVVDQAGQEAERFA